MVFSVTDYEAGISYRGVQSHDPIGLIANPCSYADNFLPEEFGSRKLQFAGGFSTGLACALLIFLKISLGLVALTFAAVSLPLRTGAHIRLAGNGGGLRRLQCPPHGLSALRPARARERVPAAGCREGPRDRRR